MTHSEFPIAEDVKSGNFDKARLSVLIVYARWHPDITTALVKSTIQTLESYSIQNIHLLSVPGCYELPLAVQANLKYPVQNAYRPYDVVIPIGVLIKGETKHFEYISKTVSHHLMKIGLEFEIPVLFGVLTCLSEEQARERAGIVGNRFYPKKSVAVTWAHTAVEIYSALSRNPVKVMDHRKHSQYILDCNSIPPETE
ncbi:hypothetical protein HMI54_003249 [Coelomomyces lativittatus]|nr:hypothetical protein HMI55_003462 [Coelomomyces lativittatus]KAJ1510383.1 hypothetical protein HMI56_006362 [Coelomomyces lativittatus]KAJ1517956.1 hypothetical protein HMI54_003249 [Coelomomyces lativittatus]